MVVAVFKVRGNIISLSCGIIGITINIIISTSNAKTIIIIIIKLLFTMEILTTHFFAK
jgi:hypothetical protein